MEIVVPDGTFYAGMKMKYFFATLFGLALFLPAYAGAVDTELKYDEVRIGYIPSRSASYKGKPHTVLEAKSLIHHENTQIEEFFIALGNVASKGITDNATRFHEPTVYIEAIFQGKSVRLFFSGESDVDRYRHYEQSWKSLHKSIFEYLSKELSPDHLFDFTP